MAPEVGTLTWMTFTPKSLSDEHWLWRQFSKDYLHGDEDASLVVNGSQHLSKGFQAKEDEEYCYLLLTQSRTGRPVRHGEKSESSRMLGSQYRVQHTECHSKERGQRRPGQQEEQQDLDKGSEVCSDVKD